MIAVDAESNPEASGSVVVIGKPLATYSFILAESNSANQTPPLVQEKRQDDDCNVVNLIDGTGENREDTLEKEKKEASHPIIWPWGNPFSPTENPEETVNVIAGDAKTKRESTALNRTGSASKEESKPGLNELSKNAASESKAEDVSPKQSSIWDAFISWIDPNRASPKSSQVPEIKKIPEDEKHDDGDSDHEIKLGGADLQSISSVNGDGSALEIPTRPEEENLENGDSVKHIASVVESKAKDIVIPDAKGVEASKKKKKKTGNKIGLTSDGATDARRKLLVKELRQAISKHGRYDISCANISAALGDLQDEGGHHEQAVKLHKDSVTIYSCKLGDDHSTTTNARLRLGIILENAGLYDEAINSYYLVTSMRRSLHGEKDPSVGDGLVCIGHALRKKGDYLQAIKELKRALKIYRESLGDANEKVATTVDEIASLYVTLGDFEKSAAILEEVVKLKAATLGTGHKAVATTLTTLATTYECSNQLKKALKSLKKAYKIFTEIGGYSSEDATATLNRMAQLYVATGDHNRASIAYLGVLRGRKIIYGTDDLLVGETYYRLAHTLRRTGQIEKALKCLREALPIYVKKATEMDDVEMLAEIIHEMALINKEKKHHIEAARIFKQELGVRRKMGQPEFPIIARTLNHLGVAEYELSNHTRALKYLVEALTIFQGQGEDSLDCAEVLFNTGLVFEAVKNKDRALEAYDEAARIFKKNGYTNDHPHLAKANHKVEKLGKKSQNYDHPHLAKANHKVEKLGKKSQNSEPQSFKKRFFNK